PNILGKDQNGEPSKNVPNVLLIGFLFCWEPNNQGSSTLMT
ncbi:unnamed protein product, partial [marine sediment metagenome]